MAGKNRLERLESVARVMGWGILLTLLLGIGSAYFPFSMINEAQARLEEKQKALENARQAPAQLRQLQERLTQTQRNLAFLEHGVSEAAYIPTMLKQIEETARSLNLKIVAIRPQQPTPTNTGGSAHTQNQKPQSKPYEEQLIEISLQGQFWSLMRFLRQLDEYPKILAVQAMNLQTKSIAHQSAETNPELEVKLTVKAFIFRSSPTNTSPEKTNGS